MSNIYIKYIKLNNLLTYDLNNFIIQDTQQLFNNLTNLRKITITLTDISSFFCRFFSVFATEKVNNSNSAHIRTQILHTPGII